jgi:GTP cyclohydrolase IA
MEYLTPSQTIKARLVANNVKHFASDNISEYMTEVEKRDLIVELTDKFEDVLDVLLIDRENDPNSMGTAMRLAKMYINELMAGRYTSEPPVTAFPNISTDDAEKYQGMLVVRSELKSMCSHHHQPVDLVCYIGIIPSDKVIGLSKYTRLARHLARRGTLQEELTQSILRSIQRHTDCRDVGVHLVGRHGCCSNRGIMQNNSSTQTTALSGQFFSSPVKQEFFDNIKMQQLKD